MIDPPWTWILDTSVIERGRASSIRPSMRCWKPSMIPRTSHPEFRASIVAAEMTEFIPGAGPPPHRIPSLTPPSFQQRGDPDKQTGRRTPAPCLTTIPSSTTRHSSPFLYPGAFAIFNFLTTHLTDEAEYADRLEGALLHAGRRLWVRKPERLRNAV